MQRQLRLLEELGIMAQRLLLLYQDKQNLRRLLLQDAANGGGESTNVLITGSIQYDLIED
jgi:hypothetical protein